MVKYQKRIRLREFSYIGCYRYFVTICTDRSKEIFVNGDIVGLCVAILKNVSEKYFFTIWVYCFMPDHLHILAEGKNEKSNFRKFISVYKQKTSYEVVQTFKFANKLWQENYYERVLRKEEATLDVIKYILNNPVRKGLVENFLNYPYLGSFVLDIRDLV